MTKGFFPLHIIGTIRITLSRKEALMLWDLLEYPLPGTLVILCILSIVRLIRHWDRTMDDTSWQKKQEERRRRRLEKRKRKLATDHR